MGQSRFTSIGASFSGIISANGSADIWLILCALFSIVSYGSESILLLTVHSVKGYKRLIINYDMVWISSCC